jgi:hypothetical protein
MDRVRRPVWTQDLERCIGALHANRAKCEIRCVADPI